MERRGRDTTTGHHADHDGISYVQAKLLQHRRLDELNHAATAFVQFAEHRAECTQFREQLGGLRRIVRFGLWKRRKLRIVVNERLQLFWRDFPGIELIAEVGDDENGDMNGNARDVSFEVFNGVELRGYTQKPR